MNMAFRSFLALGNARQFWLVLGFLTVWFHVNSPAQGADVTVTRSGGQKIRGELLVATDSAVIVKIESSIRNIWWQGDSAFAILLPLSGIQNIVVEGQSNILIGAGIGLVLGGGIAVLAGARGGDAVGSVFAGGLAGLGIGGLISHGERVFDQNTGDGFSALPDHALFGATTPKILKHIKQVDNRGFLIVP